MSGLDAEIAALLDRWRLNAEEAVRVMRLQETELIKARDRAEFLADQVQTARNEIASLREQLDRALHALSLTGRTQSAARA